MRRALIIGGNRFFGIVLTKQLREAGTHVTLVNRSGEGDADRIIKADRRDPATFAPSLGAEDFDCVFDLAAFRRADAESAITIFGGRVGRYVAVSSTAVYRLGKKLTEADFDPKTWTPLPSAQATSKIGYAEGKRAVESVLATRAPFPCVVPRLPYILGDGDRSRRVEFHIEALRAGRRVFFCNPTASMHLVSADEVGGFLRAVADSSVTGPLNFGSKEPITYRAFLEEVGKATGREARLASKETASNHSPYDQSSDKYLALDRATELGFPLEALDRWLPAYLQRAASS
jgi:nucleoside-diphosphate-sugar epimerase